ncbi:zinc finger protein jing [Populus alba x Populus x berolinensis]|nr:zinc finger protein jing [Populus alba x Populus x berolinensis]
MEYKERERASTLVFKYILPSPPPVPRLHFCPRKPSVFLEREKRVTDAISSMGKGDSFYNQEQQQRNDDDDERRTRSRLFLCERCSMGLSRISFKCVFILMLSLCLLVSALFWIFPLHSSLHSVSGFDAKDEVKLSATVQAYFRLLKPVAQLVTHIARLEYDINEEIGIPNAKVAILSMHRLASNWTDVVFGLIPDPVNVPINVVSLSVLRSSLIDLFLEQSNLTVTTLIFGQPSTFEIFRFPGGITIVPMQYASIWQMPQILFNFTLNNSISEVLDNFGDLKDQLEFGLHLRQFETVYVKITNEDGSTITPPVTVQVSVMSDLGTLQLQRLKQLAQIITASPVKNLGLNNSVFGKVKSVVLSSYLKDTLHGTPPTPSPAISPSLPPAIAPLAPVNSPAPSVIPAFPPQPCPHGSATPPSNSPSGSNQTPRLHPEPPDVSPLPGVYYGSGQGKGPLLSLVPSTLAPTPSCKASLSI